MRTRVAASTLLGVTLVVLVALATVAVAALVWARADDRARIEDDRAADVAREALQNSLGRVLTTLRVADGLVDEHGVVDPASFRAFAQAVTSMPASGSLALATVVRSPDRDRFEDASGVEIIEFVRTGVFRPAGERGTYLPIVEVWPPTSANRRLLGLDLLSEPARRRTLTLARTTRQASFTELIPLAVGRQGLLAFKPLYAPGQSDRGPVAYISASFNTSVMGDVLDRLPQGLRVGVAVDGTTVYATNRSPSSGATRSLMLGGRRWVVTARGPSPSHAAPLAILFVGAILAALLAAFTRSRASFERRLVRATESEREARQRSELLEGHAAHLAAAATSSDVALSTVADLSAAGIEIAAVHALHDGLVEVLANSGVAGELSQTEAYRLDADTAATQAMRSGEIVEIMSGDEYDRRFPARAAARRRQRVESVIAVPLRNTDGRVIGALVAASRQPRWLNRSMRLVVTGVAEQCGLALERARLQSVDEEARRRADLLQRLTGELSAAALPTDVAEASVPYLFEAFDADLCSLGVAWGDDVRTIKFPSGIERDQVDWLPVPRSNSTPTADAIRSRAVIELHGAEQIARRYPPDVEVLMHGMESMLVLPLPGAGGAIGVAFRRHRVLSVSERELLGQIARELSQALDRAALLERERDARLHAELMEKNAAHLAAAAGVTDVAAVTVADLEGAGFGIAAVCTTVPAGVEVVAVEGVSPDVVGALRASAFDDQTIIGDTLSTGRLVEVESADVLGSRYPASAELGRMLGAETLISIPLRASDRRVIGVLMVASDTPRSLDGGRRQVIHGVAEQCGLALERAQLQASAEHAAATAAFLALVAEVVERPTRAGARARRLTDVLTEERATFAAVHFADGDRPPELAAVSGSLPPELVDDEEWSKQVSHAITTRRPVFPGFGAQSAGRVDPPLVIVLPLRARGHTLGTLTLRTAADADWRPAIGLDLAREIAARAAIALDNALLYEREREVSHSLQLGLLGGALPEFDGVVAAAAYRPGTATLEVGGDWYDAFRLPSGALGLVVGDVVGHGLEAAVAMGQLRGALSALAQTGAPSRILEQLDAFVETVPEAATATIAYVELDPASGRIQYACAGHPPPLVVSPDGHTRFLWEGRSAPLGSTLGDAREQATDVLEDGETLVLYTDGLVERRRESFDHGLARLEAASKLHPPDAPTLADDLCEALLDGHSQDDDVCVLTLHRLPTVSLYRHALSADPAELAGLRESLRMWLDGLGVVDEESERSTVLAVSEAAANAIEHGYECDGVGTVIVTARLDGADRLDITVRDEGGWRDGDSEPDRGRGLAIMRAIVDDFSIARDNGGTVLRMSRSAREATSP